MFCLAILVSGFPSYPFVIREPCSIPKMLGLYSLAFTTINGWLLPTAIIIHQAVP